MLASNIKTAQTRYGDLAYFADDYYIGASLATLGEYSQLEIDFLAKIIKPDWTVIDVGANLGALTVAFADMVGPGGLVNAYEPQIETFELLTRNAEHYANVRLEHKALGDRVGSVMCPPLAQIANRNYGAVELTNDIKLGDSTKLVRLDDEFPRAHFLKIDVEGMEVEVLRGAAGLIKRCRPILYVENDREKRSVELLTLLKEYGYECFKHWPPMYNPNNFNRAPPSDRFNYISANVLAVPNEKVAEYAAVTAELRPSRAPRKPVDKRGWAGIVRLGGVGDNLMAASVLKPLKDMGYKTDVITQVPQSAVFENNPYIDKLSVKDAPRDLPANDFKAWLEYFKSRSYEYEIFANLSHTCEVSLALLESQTQFYWPAAMRRKLCGQNYLEFVHDVVGVPYTFGPLFWPTEDERDQAQETKRNLPGGKRRAVVGWCITGSRPDKIYSPSPMAIARIIRELDAHVVIFGAPPPRPDMQLAKDICEHVIGQNGSDAGLHVAISPDAANETWPIRRILTFAQACDLVISPDTGPAWAVAFEPVPKIVLHSHASVENIAKHWINTTSLHADPHKVKCWPCHQLHDTPASCIEEQKKHGLTPTLDVKGAACMMSITVEDIVRAAAEWLQKGD